MSGFLVAPVLARVITTLGIIWKLKRDAEVCGRKSDIAPCTFCARFGLMHRSKQLRLFDHFRDAGEQKMRDCDLAELTRVKRVNFPKAICA
jgi:hypothetical protein